MKRNEGQEDDEWGRVAGLLEMKPK